MTELHHPFYLKLKEMLKNATHTIKDAMADLMEQELVTIEEIAEMMKQHPDTLIEQQTLLGITYRFYRLTIENMVFYMETRVINNKKHLERVLFVTFGTTEHSLLTYRSYDDQMQLNKPIKVNNTIKTLVKDGIEKSFV
jgi:prophage DNA circulation protein